MTHYAKAQVIHCHYGDPDPKCTICGGSGTEHPIPNDPDFQLPCSCRMSNMVFDKPEDVLMQINVEPLPDGGARIHMVDVPIDKN